VRTLYEREKEAPRVKNIALFGLVALVNLDFEPVTEIAPLRKRTRCVEYRPSKVIFEKFNPVADEYRAYAAEPGLKYRFCRVMFAYVM
jgi:hypothetical protein